MKKSKEMVQREKDREELEKQGNISNICIPVILKMKIKAIAQNNYLKIIQEVFSKIEKRPKSI